MVVEKERRAVEVLTGSGMSLIHSVGAPLESVVESAETLKDRGPPPDDGTSCAVETLYSRYLVNNCLFF